MYVIDLFEADPQSGYVPVNPNRPGTINRKLGNYNLNELQKAFEQPNGPTPITLKFTNGTSRNLTSQEVDLVADYYETFKTKVERANFIYRTLVSQDKMSNLIARLKQLSLDLPPPREPDAGPEQLTLFQEKKSFDKPKYKDVNVQRAVRQAQADFPTAASDEEAFIKSMMVQQDQDQKNIDRLKTGLNRQKELLNKNSELDTTQDQTINSLNKEIHNVEKDNDNLQLSLQQMQRANAELQQALDRMRGKRVEPAPQLGVSVATDKIPAPTPTTTTSATPTNVATRQDLAKLAQRQRAISRAVKQKQLDRQKSVGTAQVGGQDVDIFPSIKKAEVPAFIKRNKATDVPMSIKREDLTHGLEEALPAKAAKELYRWKNQQNQPAEEPAGALAEPQSVPARLSDLQSRHQKIANLADIKKDIEALQARATRGGRILPRGLAADLEDYFTTADVDRDYEDMLAKYQKQLGALQTYLGMRKTLWAPKKVAHEDTKSDLYANAVAKIKKLLSNPKLDPATRKDYEARLQKFMSEGRAGYNPLTSQEHWQQVKNHLTKLLASDMPYADKQVIRQQYLEKQKEAQQKGWEK